ncbi:MAG: hypothetical protein QXR57_01340 [Metallosphaera sp.]|uniref:Uncharacterized protein n=1 Tax=Metallosphaera cuprina (strain Ar-4) TaxID=1006006 RepID=F4G256_METCR|nr:hypothetical protein [Metallosphaera cuprina]AEB96133.1 conserved hypothetical protein [Metallosphaera cuprina Ar-4]
MSDLSLIQVILIASIVVIFGSVTYVTFEEILTGVTSKKEAVKIEKRRKSGSHGR